MILYLDTSALVKLYVAEEHAQRIHSAVASASAVATHAVAYVELCSVLARKVRQGDLAESEYSRCVARFDRDWATFRVIGVTEPLLRDAAEMVRRHALRAYDSVHLAAVSSVRRVASGSVDLRFAAFDGKLLEAVGGEGIAVLE